MPRKEVTKLNIDPMLAQTMKPISFREDWLYELKLDGVRCIAFLGERTCLQGRSGSNITYQFPELQNLHRQVSKPCILDGEIGCASFNAVQKRVHKERALDIRVAERLYPAQFFAFDILFVSDESQMAFQHLARKEILKGILSPGDRGMILPFRIGGGEGLLKSTCQKGLEGIMAKSPTAQYAPGKHSYAWLKIKNFKEATFYICGLTEGEGERNSTFGSLILGEMIDGKLTYVGNVGSGFDEQQLKKIVHTLSTIQVDCPFTQISIDKPVKFWTRPIVRCEVRFLERSKEGKLRFPTFRKFIIERR